jgi:hypothetical protein
MPLQLSGVLPADHGLDEIEEALLDNPEQGHMVVLLVDRSKVTAHANGRVVVTARIREAEALPCDTAGWKSAHELLLWRHAERTGKTPLPFDK